ncbi:phage tail protein [Zoogloea sp.]|uniref:TipJ family phage tail tip protein n=1 Tax=Zoogloea sp. TaxID=49181 RepID=UPI001415E089|nr:MAG: host specificity protein J [Zoogloea sp.]
MTQENKKKMLDIVGSGGKGGGGGSADEAPNTLRSMNTVRVLEVISEGEIKGIVGGAQGIYFNNTPLQNSDGTYNFKNVTWAERRGLPDQEHIEGFSEPGSYYAVGTKVTVTTPVVYTVTGDTIDAVRATLLFTAGIYKVDNGALKGTSVEYKIQRRIQGGVWEDVLPQTITGKINSAYQRAARIERPAQSGIWQVRVVRITEDATLATVKDEFTLAGITELIDVKEPYNYSAIVGISVDAESFGGQIPKRAYDVEGIKVKIPSNYDPYTATYSGVWNGTFKVDWTDNPAWILYDVLTVNRYGLGEVIKEVDIDRYSFYQAARYNDELVSDGKGGQERRFTFNTVIQAQESAVKVVQAIAGSFRATLVSSPAGYALNQDRPADPVKIITNADVIGGQFIDKGTVIQERHTAALVQYNDKDNRFIQTTVTVIADDALVQRYGFNQTSFAAYGATTEGQAIRAGRWLLETELNQTDQIIWKSSFKHFDLQIGDVVTIYDNKYANRVGAGRITKAQASGTQTYQVELDRRIQLSATPGTLKYSTPAGKFVTANIDAAFLGGNVIVLDIQVPLNAPAPTADASFIIEQDIKARQFRIMRVTKDDAPNVIEVEGLLHDPTKYARVEQGITTTPPVYSDVNNAFMPDVSNVQFNVGARVTDEGIRRDLHISWEAPYAPQFGWYKLQWRKDNGNFFTEDYLKTPAFEIENITEATYDVVIYSYSRTGTCSRGVNATYTYSMSSAGSSPLAQPTNLGVRGTLGTTFSTADLSIEFTNPASNAQVHSTKLKDFQITVRDMDNNLLRTDYVPNCEPGEKQFYTYSFLYNVNDGGPRRTFKLTVQARDTENNLSGSTTAVFNNPVPAAPTILVGKGVKSLKVDVSIGQESDISGVLICGSTNASDLTSETVLLQHVLYQGPANFYIIENITDTMYFRAAHFDSFGTTGLAYSAIADGTPGTVAGIPVVTTLPNSPADVNNEYAVVLDSPDASQAGLWGWNGTQWANVKDGAHLVENSVTADKIYANKLSAISANMGDITSGTITLDQTGWLRGGAVDYTTGTGIWMGYHNNAYKARFGTPGSSGAEYDGSNFKIYGADGSVVLQSGSPISVNWDNVSGTGKPQDNATVGAPSGTFVGSTLAQTIESYSTTAINAINDLASDNVLTPVEKTEALKQMNSITAQYNAIDGQASAFGITTERTAHTSAYSTLYTYVNTYTSNLTTSSSISGSTWRSYFSAYFDAYQKLANAISTAASQRAVWSNVSGTGKPQDYATFGATFGVNIGGQINSSNVSTYIASAAIQNAQMGTAAIKTANIDDLSVGGRKITSPTYGSIYLGAGGVGSVYHGMNRKANVAISRIYPAGTSSNGLPPTYLGTVWSNSDNSFEIINQSWIWSWQNIGGDSYAYMPVPVAATIEYFYL